jgi:hypothetical protein
VDVVRRYRPRASRLHSCGFAARWCVSLPWFRGPIGLPVHTVGRGCDATSTPDASRCRFTTATAPASALVVNRRRRPVELPPRLTGSSRTTLVRFRVFLRPCSVHRSRRAVAGVANPATIPLRRFLPGRHPPARHAPLRFSQRLAPALLFFRVAGAAWRVIRRRFRFSRDVPDPLARSRDLGGRTVARPPTLLGFAVPSQL